MIQIQWTCENLAQAKKIAKALIAKKWVACANIFPIESLYIWEGKLQEDQEVKVIFKTQDKCFSLVRDYIIEHASYDVPEISKIPILDTNPAYAEWISAQTDNKSSQ